MLNKIRLDQTRVYERAIATMYMAEMIIGHLECREHSLRLGCEQGEIPHWDDIVIEHHDTAREHIQVKRQETSFDDRPSVRGRIATGQRRGELQDLSTLDDAMASIANTFRTGTGAVNGRRRRFTLGLPHGTVGIKKDIEVRHLRDLCSTCANPTTNVTGLEQLAVAEPPVMHLYEWLTSWCGFSDWNHIQLSMRSLSIRAFGYEADLDAIAEAKLSSHFTAPQNVRTAILHFIDDNTTYAGATTPRILLNHLSQFLRPDRFTWTQYRRDTNAVPWSISGTHGDIDTAIEPAGSVVSALWASHGRQRTLRVAAACPGVNLPPMPNALVRLAIHLPRSAQALFRGLEAWQVGVGASIAGTLGLERNDLDRLPWANEEPQINPSDSRLLSTMAEQLEEADGLSLSMDEKSWEMVCEGVSSRIEELTDPDLIAAVESLWAVWRSDWSDNPDHRRQFLRQLLHATAEGDEVLAELRVGPLTVDLLADALNLLLIVAVALGEGTPSWGNLGLGRSVRTLALRQWGGPSGRIRGPRQIDEDGLALLGKESADVVILSGYVGSPGQLEEESLADDASLHDNFGMPRCPKLLITNSRSLRKIIRQGTLENIRQYLQNELRVREEARARNISEQAGGVNNGN